MNPILMDAVIKQAQPPVAVPSSIPTPAGMNIPPPAGMAPPVTPLDIAKQQAPQSLYKPMPIPKKQPMAPRAQPPMGDAVQQVMPHEPDDSPILRGIQSGIHAARESYALTDEQRRRAEGDAIMAFFGNMARSQNPSALGSAAESMYPAMQQYGASERAAQGLNKEAVDMLLKEQREARLASQQVGGLKVGNQIQLINNYTTKMADLNSRRNTLISTMWNNLPEEKRTQANLDAIKKRADQELAPYLHEIQKIKAYAMSQGFDLDSMSSVGENVPRGTYGPTSGDYGYEPPEPGSGAIAQDGTDMASMSLDQLYAIVKRGR